MNVLVVGSGLSGYWCAKALSDRGFNVTVMDGGQALDAATQQHLASGEIITANPTLSDAIPKKYRFGSGYVYDTLEARYPIERRGVDLSATLAKGGFSTIWGATLLSYRAQDLRSWPLAEVQLAPYYQRILSEIPYAGEDDVLDAQFPLYAAPQHYTAGVQMERWLHHLRAQHFADIHVGRARLALDVSRCNYSGYCLTGCPQNAIYSTETEIQKLPLTYLPHHIIEQFRETAESIEVRVFQSARNETITQHFDKIFLATGPVQTARIVLNSVPALDSLTLKTSQKFLLPWLLPYGMSLEEPHLALASVFMETDGAHLQFTGSNRMIRQRAKFLPPALTNRLIAMWGALHSDDSATIRLSLQGRTLVQEGLPNAATPATVKSILRKLRRHSLRMRALPLTFLHQITLPGGGSHYGGSLPMHKYPAAPQHTDPMGKLYGHRHVHIVDASIFPTIPPGTIGLSIMANAMRIGTQIQ